MFFPCFPYPSIRGLDRYEGWRKARKFSVNDKVFADIARRVEALYQPEIY
jgi:hypothetical protein